MTVKQIFNLPIGPGQYTEQSERGAVGRWYSMDKVRFRKGLAEKIGGWVQLQPQFVGIARRLRDWSSLDAKRWSAVATDTKLYLWQNGNLYDITPLRRTVTLTAPFQTFTGESRVRVTDTNHGAQLGAYVTFSGAIAGGASGLTVDGEYVIDTIIDPDTYEITDDETATTGGSGEGGTAVLAEYQLNPGGASVTTATGYGTGPYGREGYGNARTGSTLQISIRTWALDTWGEDLLACPRGGAIYWWDRSKGTGTRAVALGGDAPPNNEYMLVSQRDRHVIALGAFDFFNQAFDPLLIRWSSTEDLNDWVPTSTNTSGDLRLYSGSRIVAGVRSRLETVIFTDVSVHTMPFVGGFDVFGLNIVGENVSILGPNCAVPIDHRVVFMAESDFYVYDGIVKVLPCDVRNFVYDNLNTVQRDKIYGGLNREFNEIWWFYPSFDVNGWVQQDFSLGLPSGYSVANSSNVTGDPQFSEVQLLAKFEGADAATTYTEVSQNGASATFNSTAEIDTAQFNFGASSLELARASSEDVTFPDIAAYDLGTSDWTIEGFVRFTTLPPLETSAGPGHVMFDMRNTGAAILQYGIIQDTFGYRVRIEGTSFSEVATISGGISTGVWYHWAITRTGGQIRAYFNGNYEVGDFGTAPANLGGPDQAFIIGSRNSTDAYHDGHIDDVRMTIGTARYTGTGTYTVPTVDFPEFGSGPANIGYSYVFNSFGYTEVLATADNNYEHDYFLTNDEPILTPLESEYAVELDVHPSIGMGTGLAGLCFLRLDAVGTGLTDADDCNQWMVELDFANDLVQIVKKEAAAPAAPDNLMANTTGFTALTGAAMATDTKYVIKVQVDTPQITVWVDDNQAFQFNMSAAELALFTGGTAGFHMRADASNDQQYRFYNFATSPTNVISQTTFDISPIEVNRYVIFNYEEGTWATGELARTAWADRSPLLEKAYAAGTDGYLYQHETGTDDNGAALPSFIESFDMEIPEAGENLMHVDQLIPDFLRLEGSVDVYLTGRKYPQDPNRISKGPYLVQNGTRKLSTRIRARQIALRVESSASGDKWRMATWRGRAGAHGKRG